MTGPLTVIADGWEMTYCRDSCICPTCRGLDSFAAPDGDQVEYWHAAGPVVDAMTPEMVTNARGYALHKAAEWWAEVHR